MSVLQKTYQQQSDLANYCRTNHLSAKLEVNRDHVHHYRRLVYNIIDDSLQTAYPLTFNLVTEEEWNDLVHRFFSQHKSQSAQVWKMPFEFYEYWKSVEHPIHQKYPFLSDLLLFEWMEVEVFMMEDIVPSPHQENGNPLEDPMVFNPEHRFLHVHYPVHLKTAKNISKDDQGDYYMLGYREFDTGKVQFLDLSVLLTLILENLIQGLSLNEIANELVTNFHFKNSQEVVDNTLPFLENLKIRKFLLGFYRL